MSVHSLYLSRLTPEQREGLKSRLFERQNSVCFICEDPKAIHFQWHCEIYSLVCFSRSHFGNSAISHSLVCIAFVRIHHVTIITEIICFGSLPRDELAVAVAAF